MSAFSRLKHLWKSQNLFNLVLAIGIGTLSGWGAVLFHHVLATAQYAFYQSSDDFLVFGQALARWKIVALPTLGGLIVGIIVYLGASEARGHGVPEVMSALALRGGRIRKRVALVKIVASAICIGSGGSSGREGPMVQIGAGIGSTLSQFFKIPVMQQRTMVGCGAAAGIAATFNAPVAGVLFALEVLIGDFGLAAFSPVVISSVTATAISRAYWGDFPTFSIPEYQIESLWEFGLYPLLGIFAALAAVSFVTVLYKTEDVFEALPVPEWFKPAIGGLLLGCIVLQFPEAFGVGYGAMNQVLHSQNVGPMLFVLVLVKIFATSATLGSGGSGGIFAPSLFIGAMAGGAFGWAAGELFPGTVALPGAYALVGMGAVVAGTTHAPITAILIIFEMTGDYKIILPMMITCIVATTAAAALKEGSIYTIKLKRRGIDISGGFEQNVLRSLKVKRFMDPHIMKISEGMPLVSIIETFKNKDISYLHVVNQHEQLTGIISFRDVRTLLDETDAHYLLIARDIATRDMVTVSPEESIQVAMKRMTQRGISQLPVVGGPSGAEILGALYQKDVLAAYDKAVIRRELEEVE